MNVKSVVKDYLLITAAICLYSVAVTFFLLPYQLTTGGVTGIGALIYYATGFEVQNSYLIINALLLCFAIKELGWKFCMKTVYAVLALTFMLWATQRLYELMGSPKLVGDELFMACLIGAMMEGFGLGICFMSGGSTGGTDIIAAIVNKYRNISLGTVIMLMDVIIISSCYFVFHDLQRVIFGFVLLLVSSFTLDFYVTRYRQAVEFKIFSRNPHAIANAIIRTGRGVTMLDGMGYYTKSERKVVLCVVRRREQMTMFSMIKSIDPYAFVTMANVSGVWGEGFDVMRVKEEKNALRRRVLVVATDEEDELAKVRGMFGANYEIRSLKDIGCDVNNPVNSDILTRNAVLRARFVKQFYGFDSIAYGNTLEDINCFIYAVAKGDALAQGVKIEKFNTLEECKVFLADS